MAGGFLQNVLLVSHLVASHKQEAANLTTGAGVIAYSLLADLTDIFKLIGLVLGCILAGLQIYFLIKEKSKK